LKKLVMIPGPTNVSDRVMWAMLSPIINHRSHDFGELYSAIEKRCKNVFLTKNEVVVLSASGTGGVDASLGSLLQDGDNLVVPSFGEFSSRLGDSARYSGANVIVPEAKLGTVPSLDEIEKALKSVPKVKALCVVYNETSTGVTWRKLRELKELVEKYGALYVVDAISVLGGDSLPVDDLGVDICIGASQKCIAAPPGIAMVSVSDEAKKAMDEVKTPRTQYFHLPKYFKYAEIGETPYTPALSLFFALNEALKMVEEEGLEKRIRRHSHCAKAFYDAFEALDLKPFVENKEMRSNTVIGILYPQGIDDKKFRTLLDDKFGILIAGGFGALKGKMFRVGSMGEINEKLVSNTVSGIGESIKVSGHNCQPSMALEAAWKTLSMLHSG